MRNLKRALSLGLTAAMISGLMVMGSSAAGYADVTSEENQEAIEVLQAVGIMVGDDNGNFNPDQEVTRNEMAVVMANLMEYNVASYRGTSPFTDVPSWAEPYVAACYTNGITSGYSATIYGGSDSVTTAQAALMLMKALGYFQYASDFGGDWQLATLKQGNNIDLFVGVDSRAEDALTRNDVAQLVLNTLEAGTVQASTGGNITIGGVTINTDVQYDYVTSGQSYASAIDDKRTTNNDGDLVTGSIVELGEQLYMGNLKLDDSDIDDFGRPARTWTYEGQDIGTYAKRNLLQATYTVEVEGGDIYSDIGSTACDYDLLYWVDGVQYDEDDTKVEAKKLERRNDDAMSETGNGVLTEVYVDTDAKETTIAQIHTYLAQVTGDYNDRNDTLRLGVYTADDSPRTYVAELDDVANLKDFEDEDWVLVTMADDVIMSVADAEIIGDQSATKYTSNSNGMTSITANGTKYDVAYEAHTDAEILKNYTLEQLYQYRYDLYMDAYGYVIGIAETESADNYAFIVGYENGSSVLASVVDKALMIFPDGRMEVVDAQDKDTEVYDNSTKTWKTVNAGYFGGASGENAAVHQWVTYTMDGDVYEIERVVADQGRGTRVGASNRINDENNTFTISNVPEFAFGNDESVFITVDADKSVDIKGGSIVKVNGVTTGIGNTNIEGESVSSMSNFTSGMNTFLYLG